MLNNAVKLNFSGLQNIDGINTPEAYEKLLFDCDARRCNQFSHWEEVALSWKFIDPISRVWENNLQYVSQDYAVSQRARKFKRIALYRWFPLVGDRRRRRVK